MDSMRVRVAGSCGARLVKLAGKREVIWKYLRRKIGPLCVTFWQGGQRRVRVSSMASDGDGGIPLTEPEVIPCVFLSGADFIIENGVVLFTGWQEVEGERRVRVRYAIAVEAIRPVHMKLRRALGASH
jgi:hypothetical protein